MIQISIATKEKGYEYYQGRVVVTRVQHVIRPESGGTQYLNKEYRVQNGTGPVEVLPVCIGNILFNGIKLQEPAYPGDRKEIEKWETEDIIYTRISLYPVVE